jgi:hypothetical protein
MKQTTNLADGNFSDGLGVKLEKNVYVNKIGKINLGHLLVTLNLHVKFQGHK